MDLRIQSLVVRKAPIEIVVDGHRIPAYPGESVAAALLAAGIRQLRSSPSANTPRGVFCLMGVCQECVVRVGEKLVQSCLEPVAAGMAITLDRRS